MKIGFKKLIYVLLVFISYQVIAQDVKTIKSGTITLINDEEINFVDLKYEGDQVLFTNTTTQLQEHLFLPSIKNIEEKEIVQPKIKKSLINQMYPDGIYATKEDFLKKTPTSELGNFTFAQHEKSELHYGFLDDDRKNLKKSFAVSYNGDVFINASDIIPNRKFGNYITFKKDDFWFYKANLLGNNLEVFGEFQPNNRTFGIFGAIGSLIGSGISELSKKTIPVIYDFKVDGFAVIHKNQL